MVVPHVVFFLFFSLVIITLLVHYLMLWLPWSLTELHHQKAYKRKSWISGHFVIYLICYVNIWCNHSSILPIPCFWVNLLTNIFCPIGRDVLAIRSAIELVADAAFFTISVIGTNTLKTDITSNNLHGEYKCHFCSNKISSLFTNYDR